MRRLVPVLGVIALAATLALALPASATHTNQTDPNDTAGRLDVRTVLLAHDETPRWRIDTFAAWTIRRLWDRGFLTVELDTLGDAGVDHLVVIRSDGRELTATLVRVRADGSHRVIAILDADKDGPGGAAVSVALRRLAFGSDRTSYRWSVTTSFVGGACPQTCLDHVPDEDMIEQPLPGVTPTPSPTPSPTPTPSAG